MNKLLFTFAFAALAMLPLSAQPKGGPGKHDPFAELKLTDQQKKSIDALQEKHKPAREAKHKALEEAEKTGDEAKIKEARKAMRESREAFMKECDAILTPEQKVQMEKQRAKWKAERKH